MTGRIFCKDSSLDDSGNVDPTSLTLSSQVFSYPDEYSSEKWLASFLWHIPFSSKECWLLTLVTQPILNLMLHLPFGTLIQTWCHILYVTCSCCSSVVRMASISLTLIWYVCIISTWAEEGKLLSLGVTVCQYTASCLQWFLWFSNIFAQFFFWPHQKCCLTFLLPSL